MQWGGAGSLNSYGVFYKEENTSYATDTRMFEKYIFDTSHIAPYQTTLPNNAYYTVDGKSLEVYLNRQRLTIDTDYTEIDSRTINYQILMMKSYIRKNLDILIIQLIIRLL